MQADAADGYKNNMVKINNGTLLNGAYLDSHMGNVMMHGGDKGARMISKFSNEISSLQH